MSCFELSEDQREFRRVLRRFVEEKIAPLAAGYDEREEYPWESFKACVDMELTSLWVPAAYGGQGADVVTQALSIEEVSRACASTASRRRASSGAW